MGGSVDVRPPTPDVSVGRSGYLAVSPEGVSLRIAVTAATRERAEEAFERSWDRWVRLLAEDEPDEGRKVE